ncbi:MAG TPA: hypothetical protein DDW55_11215 [Gammaproteobacteria bacterium]|nr:hypothetical protein [Gammaproteobacteria bacterium]
MKPFQKIRITALISLLIAAAPSFAADQLDKVIDTQKSIDDAGTSTQKKIDALADETQDIVASYRTVTRRTESLRIYNKHLEKTVSSQEDEMASMLEQIESLETTNREIVPLMFKMLAALDKFIAADLPFLPEERSKRMQGLTEMMDRADVTTSEKYRRIMEAFQIENEYGRTIEAYRATLESENGKRTVDFLRLGRVALYYQTLDNDEQGSWDNVDKEWVVLDDSYRRSIQEGLRIARKQSAPNLLKLPVRAPEKAQ